MEPGEPGARLRLRRTRDLKEKEVFDAFDDQPPPEVEEADVRRVFERLGASVGRTPEGELIVPAWYAAARARVPGSRRDE
jgi:hypothetical protein